MNDSEDPKHSPPKLMTEEEIVERLQSPEVGGCESQACSEPLLLTKTQAAKKLGLAASSIDWLLRKKAIPHRKIGRIIRFTRSDLQALIEASAVTQCCAAEQKGA